MKTALKFAIARLKEGSTIRGLLLCATAVGITLKPEVSDAIVAFGMAAAGLFGVFVPE